jgi:hypothetical protein
VTTQPSTAAGLALDSGAVLIVRTDGTVLGLGQSLSLQLAQS